MNEEMALMAALQRDIADRLRPVCAMMSEESFEQLVREIAAVKLKYDGQTESSTSLRLELTSILGEESGGGGQSPVTT